MSLNKSGRGVVSVQNKLTTGKPTSVIAKLWGSVMVGSALMQVYSAVNGILTGHYLGVDALGGISAAGIITSLINGALYNLMRGFTIPMSRAYGAGDFPRVRQLLWPGLLSPRWFCSLSVTPFSDS